MRFSMSFNHAGKALALSVGNRAISNVIPKNVPNSIPKGVVSARFHSSMPSVESPKVVRQFGAAVLPKNLEVAKIPVLVLRNAQNLVLEKACEVTQDLYHLVGVSESDLKTLVDSNKYPLISLNTAPSLDKKTTSPVQETHAADDCARPFAPDVMRCTQLEELKDKVNLEEAFSLFYLRDAIHRVIRMNMAEERGRNQESVRHKMYKQSVGELVAENKPLLEAWSAAAADSIDIGSVVQLCEPHLSDCCVYEFLYGERVNKSIAQLNKLAAAAGSDAAGFKGEKVSDLEEDLLYAAKMMVEYYYYAASVSDKK